MMPICDYNEPNYWLSCMTLKKGSKIKPIDIMEKLENENIESRPVWKPMHIQPFFEKYDFFTNKATETVSEDLFNRGICLPSDTKMTKEDILRVVRIVNDLFDKAKTK
ncbi:DegT/DnrJ/EryC1/StrS family aminotransferase [Paraclostridium benzoelyticum]